MSGQAIALNGQGQSGLSTLPSTLKFGLAIVLLWVMAALFAPWLTPLDPNAIDLENVLQPPGGQWLLGTDHVGRDILTRVIFAARVDLWMGFLGVLAPALIGVTIGLFSGYFGGLTDAVMMRAVDITLAFPFLILVLAIVAMLGPGVGNFIIALAVVAWVSYARLIRAEVMVIKNSEYIQAAKTLGYHPMYIIFRHVLPNALSPVIVYAMTDAILVILAGASLGFIGLGVQPPTAEWGVMIADGQPYVIEAWWICFFPGLAAISLGIGLSLIGDGLARILRVSG
jgi:peptide/nickel transport system permease protein